MTTTYLVTGGAGFIGSNFVLYMLDKYKDAPEGKDIRIINVDALTYAGNLENLASVEDDPRHIFVQADIRDKEAMAALLLNTISTMLQTLPLNLTLIALLNLLRFLPTPMSWER